jgi:hypothetical protein
MNHPFAPPFTTRRNIPRWPKHAALRANLGPGED